MIFLNQIFSNLLRTLNKHDNYINSFLEEKKVAHPKNNIQSQNTQNY